MKYQSLMTALLSLLLFSCASQQSMFEKTKESNTIEAYETFLRKYPTGELAELAKNELARLEYERAKQINTISSYRAFLKNFPNSKFEDQARSQLKSLYVPSKQTIMDVIGKATAAKYPNFFPSHSVVSVGLQNVGTFNENLGYLIVIAKVGSFSESTATMLELGVHRFKLYIDEAGNWKAEVIAKIN